VPFLTPWGKPEEAMIEKLASSLGINNEEPNIALALELAASKNKKGIREIVDGLKGAVPVANDCIKVLYETGYREPLLIADHVGAFLDLLNSKNNRVAWGSMIALSTIAGLKPKEIYDRLDAVLQAYEKGSVITIDNCISVFAELVKAGPQYGKKIFPIILKHLATCRAKEVGQHAERAFVCVTKGNAEAFKAALLKRRDELTDAQKKRVDKLVRRIDAGSF
jgi:hypothetical protein